MKHWRSRLIKLSCKDKECKYLDNYFCSKDGSPWIMLFGDGTYECESKEEQPKNVHLTEKELCYIGYLLERERCEDLCSDESKLIQGIAKKLEETW